jgi:DNA-binding transcriptional LysR family regulator
VRITGVVESGLAVRKVGQFGSAVYASKGYLARRGRPREGDWAGHDFVGYSDPLMRFPDSQWIEERAGKGRVVFRTVNTLAHVAAAVGGLGITVLPCYAGDAEPELVRLVPSSRCVRSPIWLVVHEDMRQSARIRAISDFLADELRAIVPRLLGVEER